MEKEWRRWRTSFSSVPALTCWERDVAGWEERGEDVRTELLGDTALSLTQEDGTYPWDGGGIAPLFHHHSVDDTIFLHFRHSGLNQRQIRVSKQSFSWYFYPKWLPVHLLQDLGVKSFTLGHINKNVLFAPCNNYLSCIAKLLIKVCSSWHILAKTCPLHWSITICFNFACHFNLQ